MADISGYLKEGYELSPYFSNNDVRKATSVKVVDLGDKEISDMVSLDLGEESKRNYLRGDDENQVVVFRVAKQYHYGINDLLRLFDDMKSRHHTQDEMTDWARFFDFSFNGRSVFQPELFDEEKYYGDYLFREEDHVYGFVVGCLRSRFFDGVDVPLEKFETFIKETVITKDDKKYSNPTKSLIIQNLAYILGGTNYNASYGMRKYYHDNLLALANDGDYDSMRTLGYEYYEGTNGFELDAYKATELLEKCFNISRDPDLARTLGYIYYYGRTTNGEPQKDKAFQYFAIGHIAGGYYEATYKLADCYVKGYGTPVCYQAAYNLVDKAYGETYDYFAEGKDSKFADLALRMGSYFKDGIFVEKNLRVAKDYFLEARTAIKQRLEHMEYIGDRGIAVNISKTLEELNAELGCAREREIYRGGYLLENYNQSFGNVDFKFKLVEEGLMQITFTRPKNVRSKYFLHIIPSINFSERCKVVNYLLECITIDEDTIKELSSKKVEGIEFYNGETYIHFVDQTMYVFKSSQKIIYIPETLKDIDRKYTIATVEFYPNSKQYDYLAPNANVNVGDKLTVDSNGKIKTVTVKHVKYLYEDELPLPYEKMAKAR